MNLPIAATSTAERVDDGTWLGIAPGTELVVASPNHMVDMGVHGLAYPVLKIQRRPGETDGHSVLYTASVTWILPNGRPSAHVQMELITVGGNLRATVARHPNLAYWVSALVERGQARLALSKDAFEAWGTEAQHLQLAGRVHQINLLEGYDVEDTYERMLGQSLCLVNDVVSDEADGDVEVLFSLEDCCMQTSATEELLEAGHAARGKRRERFLRLGAVPLPAAEPGFLGVDDGFQGDYPEVFLVTIDHEVVYPDRHKHWSACPAGNPLNIPAGISLQMTQTSLALQLGFHGHAEALLHIGEENRGGSCSSCYDAEVQWTKDGAEVGKVTLRIIDSRGHWEDTLAERSELADWLSTIAEPAAQKIAFLPDVQSAWTGSARWGATSGAAEDLVGQVVAVDVDKAYYRPRVMQQMLMLSLRMVRDLVAERTTHQRHVNFTIDSSAVLVPGEGISFGPAHEHSVEVAKQFEEMGFRPARPMVHGLFDKAGTPYACADHPRVFVIPYEHAELKNSGSRSVH